MTNWILKYDPEWLSRGEIEIAGNWIWVFVFALMVAMIIWALTYTGRRNASRSHRAYFLVALRTASLTLMFFLLLEPVLVIDVNETSQSRIAVLIDNSKSMNIADSDGRVRSEAALAAFAPAQGDVARDLESRFQVDYFQYGSGAAQIKSAEDLPFDSARSDLAAGIAQVLSIMQDDPLSAIIVLGDGGYEAGAELDTALRGLRAREVALHAIGMGKESFMPDLEISQLELAAQALKDESLDARLRIQHQAMAGKLARLVVEDEGFVVHEESLRMPAEGDSLTLNIPLRFDVAGVHRLKFRLQSDESEQIDQNNTVNAAVDVIGRKLKVLHVEGEPRFEVKFLRRAVQDDPNIQLVSLVRTAENKYYRLGVDSPDQLVNGFPETAEELFQYDALVIGSFEAAALDENQQALLREFVSSRGGGVLFLGGRYALDRGGYANSSLAGMLPVYLDSADTDFRAAIKIDAAQTAEAHPMLKLDTTSVKPWQQLPKLTTVNAIRRAKPGANILLQGEDDADRSWIVMAHQRYGSGQVVVFAVRDSWRWQMHSSIALDDLTHELLWRQLLRSLALPARQRLAITGIPAQTVPGETVSLEMQVANSAFKPEQNAALEVSVVNPLGDIKSSQAHRIENRPGHYRASFTVNQTGVYEVQATVKEDDTLVASTRSLLRVENDGNEYFNSGLNAKRLQNLAVNNGGKYFNADNLNTLAASLSASTIGQRVSKRLPIWDAPIWLILLFTLLFSEWVLRRRLGYA